MVSSSLDPAQTHSDRYQGTIVMNDKELHYTRSPNTASDAPLGEQFGARQDCEWDGQGGGKCEQDVYEFGADRTATTTFKTTITGPTVPVATLTVGVTDGSGNGSGSGNGNGAAISVAPGMILVGCGVLLGFMSVIIV